MSEVLRAVATGSAALGLALGWLVWRALRTEGDSPDRLILELRIAQFSALLLVLVAGIYVGLALAHEETTGAGLDVAIAVGFFVVAGIITTREPAVAITALSVAWVAHSLLDLAHVTNLLPGAIAPGWYPIACSVYNVCVAAICYLPLLRR